MTDRRSFLTVLFLGSMLACAGIRLEDIEAPRPVPTGSCLVVGFLGGRDAWNDEQKGVRRLALRVHDPRRRLYAQTFENRRRDIARAYLIEALDRDRDHAIGGDESAQVVLVVYGQSFGGVATVKLARDLERAGGLVRLTLQIDSVGRGDGEIPPNVRFAANLYQDNGWFISGEHPIRAADLSRTRVLGNWRFDYSCPPGANVPIDDLPWWKIALRVAHAKMDRDPRVWQAAEALVRAACEGDDLEQVASEIASPEACPPKH